MPTSSKVLVLFSGGLDSSTLLALAVERYGADNVVALSVYYGQKHQRELESAKDVASYYGVEHHIVDLEAIFRGSNCSLLQHSDEPIPTSSYAAQQDGSTTSLISTYVPFRNGLFLSVAASVALSYGCSKLMYGAHHDDVAGDAYPDCSQDFVEAMGRSIVLGTGGELSMEAPFVTWSKADVVAEGLRLKVPYEKTWSCYEGGSVPCGVCGTCIDRIRAFELNGATDPLLDHSDTM